MLHHEYARVGILHEELMCRVIGNLVKDGRVVKLADDLLCGGTQQKKLFTTGAWCSLPNNSIICNSVSPRMLYARSQQTFWDGLGVKEF